MKRMEILGLMLAVALSGCAAPKGTATSERTVRSYDAAGNLMTETVERDDSMVKSPALFSKQAIENFSHQRSNFLGSSSRTGFDRAEADPDDAALDVLGRLLVNSLLAGAAGPAALAPAAIAAPPPRAPATPQPEPEDPDPE